jgi:lipid A 3-O-deacylase
VNAGVPPLRRLRARILPVALALLPALAPAVTPAPVEDEPLRFGSVTLYAENDLFLGGTDQYYTHGFKLSFLTTRLASFTEDPVPQPVQQLARTLGGLLPAGPDYKLGLSLGQNLYTPSVIRTPEFQANDRPYAAWLYLGSAFQIARPASSFANGSGSLAKLDVFEVTLGMVGPAALGRQVQNNVHRLFGVATAKGSLPDQHGSLS